MTALPFRTRHFLVSFIGAVFILPVYLFWGGLFCLSYSIYDSVWAWGFGLIACWSQIMAVLASFFNPRKAAWCMIANSLIGVLLAGGFLVRSGHSDYDSPIHLEQWMSSASGLFRTIAIFWVPPLSVAFFLLRSVRPVDRVDPKGQPAGVSGAD